MLTADQLSLSITIVILPSRSDVTEAVMKTITKESDQVPTAGNVWQLSSDRSFLKVKT